MEIEKGRQNAEMVVNNISLQTIVYFTLCTVTAGLDSSVIDYCGLMMTNKASLSFYMTEPISDCLECIKFVTITALVDSCQ